MIQSLTQLVKKSFQSITVRAPGQIAAFDGLRAFAVLLVIAIHAGQSWFKIGGQPNFVANFPLVQGGWIGVDLFFCLSGFFIGRQLWREVAQTGDVQVGKFILRRGFRIWPLYFVIFILSYVSETVMAHFSGETLNHPIWPDLLFLSNYFRGYWVPGSWSLSTEEQFYLIIPTLVLGLSYLSFFLSKKRKSLTVGRYFFVILFFVAPLVRALVWKTIYHPGDDQNALILSELYYPFHTHMDGLIVGMFLSNLYTANKFKTRKEGSNLKQWATLFGLLILGVALKKLNHIIFEYSALTLIFGGIMWFCLNTAPSLLNTFLSWKGFYLVSRLSYGMYLLHQIAMHMLYPMIQPGNITFLSQSALFSSFFVATVILTAILAFFGFTLVEQPFLEFRHKLGIDVEKK